jgi:hypothetical protein
MYCDFFLGEMIVAKPLVVGSNKVLFGSKGKW